MIRVVHRRQIEDDYWHGAGVLPKAGFLTVERSYQPALCFQSPAHPVWVVHGVSAAIACRVTCGRRRPLHGAVGSRAGRAVCASLRG